VSAYPSFCLSAGQHVGLSACLPVGLSTCLSVGLSCLSIHLPGYLSVTCLPVCLYARLSACLHEISNDCRINNIAYLLILQIHDCGSAVADEHSLKSCGIVIAEVLLSSCRIAIADIKKDVHAHLRIKVYVHVRAHVNVHSAFTCPCCMSMFMLYVYVHAE
jgi:hypothetical protein